MDRLTAETILVARAQTGDSRAFNALYGQYSRVIYSLARHMVGNDDAAADITQEVFVRAWRALPRLKEREAFGGWIRTIALNQVRDWARSQRPTNPLESDGTDETPRQWADDGLDPAEQLQVADRQRQVREAIQRLGDDQKLVVVMHHLEGKPVADISEQLGIPVGTVLSRLARGREALRRKLAPYVEE